MKRTRILRVLSAMLLTLAATAWAAGGSSKLPPAGYDESRDSAADLPARRVRGRQGQLQRQGEERGLPFSLPADPVLPASLPPRIGRRAVALADSGRLHEGRQVRPGPDPGVPGEMGTEKGRRWRRRPVIDIPCCRREPTDLASPPEGSNHLG